MTRMTCEEALALVMDLLKRELPADLAAEVERHLEACRPCERYASFEARFVTVVATRLGTGQCPDQLKRQIAEALAREERNHPPGEKA